MIRLTIFILFITSNLSMAQYINEIRLIKEAPSTFEGNDVLKRMIEGAGFRYYWATEGLLEKDMLTKPCEECRNTKETLEHILSLSLMVKSTVVGEVFDRNSLPKEADFKELVTLTNQNWAVAANSLAKEEVPVKNMLVDFGGGRKVPFWNVINGPLADAIYHTGQVVTFRRMSGNPINPKVNVFMGKLNN